MCVCDANLTHSKHVIALHVLGVLVITLVVKLPEEVEGQNSVEIDDHCQQAHSQDQLTDTYNYTSIDRGRWVLICFFIEERPQYNPTV